jgi:type II secretory pathway component GspD/PulD (secretin)
MLSPFRMALVAIIAATPLAAQNPRRQAVPPRTQQPAPMPPRSPADTGQHGYALDFQDQDLKVVLSALAEAGNLNMTYSNIPARKVTLRVGTAATKAEIEAMVQAIADANELKVTHNGSLTQIVGPPLVAAPTAQQQIQQNAAANELKVYTYPLKHASATSLAPLLTSVFANTTAATGNTIVTNPGTVQFNGALPGAGTTGAGGGGRNGGGGAGGGGGGRGAGGFNAGGANALGVGVGGGAANPLAGIQGLQSLFGGAVAGTQVRVVAEPSTNTLIIRASASDYALIQQVVASVDLRPMQVLIEVTIAEVTRTHDLDVGVSGLASSKNKPADSAFVASTASARDFILRLTGGGGAVDYNVALNALSSRGNTKVLSLPVIIAQNNVQAVLNVGESRPFVQVNQSVTTGTVPTTVQTIQYIDVGTTLTLTPIINHDGYVNLTVDQTDNSATTEVEFDAPVISKREATTQVFLRDGQTTVLGGLAGKSVSKTVSGIPILDKIPIIGTLLFGNTTESTTTSELYLFLTPHIIMGDIDIDRLRSAVQNGTELLKQEQVPMGARIVPQADTIHVPTAADSLLRRQDSIRKADSVAKAKRPGGPAGR